MNKPRKAKGKLITPTGEVLDLSAEVVPPTELERKQRIMTIRLSGKLHKINLQGHVVYPFDRSYKPYTYFVHSESVRDDYDYCDLVLMTEEEATSFIMSINDMKIGVYFARVRYSDDDVQHGFGYNEQEAYIDLLGNLGAV